MTEQSAMPCSSSEADHLTVAALRTELKLTLAEMGGAIGLSKSQMHEVERTERASLRVALEIERLSGGRIDAAQLSEDVRLSRHGLIDSAASALPSTGQCGDLSAEREAAE